MTECPKCKSKAIVNQRVDSDWHNNPAYAVNGKECYTPEQLHDLKNGRIQRDVDVCICLDCDERFL